MGRNPREAGMTDINASGCTMKIKDFMHSFYMLLSITLNSGELIRICPSKDRIISRGDFFHPMMFTFCPLDKKRDEDIRFPSGRSFSPLPSMNAVIKFIIPPMFRHVSAFSFLPEKLLIEIIRHDHPDEVLHKFNPQVLFSEDDGKEYFLYLHVSELEESSS